jgi:cation-transporting ATPase E
MEARIISKGLSPSEVHESEKRYGRNVDKTHDLTTVKIILKTIFSLFNIVMAVLIFILFLINQRSTAQFIGIIAVINTVIALVQEVRARLTVKKLSKLSEKTTNVLRNGRREEIPVSELVIGDVIRLTSGDRIPVDGKLLSAAYAEFDESILTGESKYQEKRVGDEVKAGSFLAAGSCDYTMTKFTRDSYIQSLTKQIGKLGITSSPLQSQINQIIKALTYMTIFFIILIVAEGLVQENQKEEIIINAATLVSSLVPQGLVLITTISFAYGAMKIARSQAIVQKLSAIEAMANTKVICMDKTGTLTKNELEVKAVKEVS